MKYIKNEMVDGVAICRINRPEALNALNADLLTEIGELVDQLEKDPDLKVFILTGEGKAFVAGADIAAMSEYDEKQALEFSNLGQTVFSKLENSRLVSIGLINGFALGGGLELALACDFRYASTKAKLGLPEVSLGLIPGFGGTQRLSRLIGIGLASEWVFSGDMFSAEQAFDARVVNRIFEPDELLPAGMKIAQSIQSRGKIAIQTAKKVIRDGLNQKIDDGMISEQKKFSGLFGTPESKEGMTAFLGKRKANF